MAAIQTSYARARPRRAVQRRRATDTLRLELAVLGIVAALFVGLLLWQQLRPYDAGPARAAAGLTPAQARAINAAIPFAAEAWRTPRRFRFAGTPAAREQATDCLATAAIYEAGHDPRGQRAVMQVVLNRVGMRGFPDTVCGVVYAGAGRASGCQFSFTCDGSLQRRPEHRGWAQARLLARRALRGAVFAVVGRSTHYHTDWVAPGWSLDLDKVAQVGSHIFYQTRAGWRRAG